jgi:hypothetical protein
VVTNAPDPTSKPAQVALAAPDSKLPPSPFTPADSGGVMPSTVRSQVSPWNVLGWILVAAVLIGGSVSLGVYLHRQLVLTRAREQTMRVAAEMNPHTTVMSPPAVGDNGGPGGSQPVQPEKEASDESQPAVDVEDWLAGMEATYGARQGRALP